MSALDVIKDTLVENLDLDPETITEETSLASLGIDSLDMVELICDVEEKLDVELGEPEGLNTIGDIVSYIESL